MAYLSYIKAFDCRTCINKGKKKKCIVRKGGRGGMGGGVGPSKNWVTSFC